MLKQSHVSVSSTCAAALCLKLQIPLPATICLIAGTYFGAQLPDVDHPKSKLNRMLGPLGHVFTKLIHHRTWTHTIWAIIGIFLLAIFVNAPNITHPILIKYGISFSALRLLYLGIAFGYLMHVIEDSFSTLGVCWTYPLRKYNFYKGHPFKMGHKHFWNYKTGGKEETVIRIISNILFIVLVSMMILGK